MTLGTLLYEPTPEELADACALLRQARDAVELLMERHGEKLASGGSLRASRARKALTELLTLDDTYDQATGE